MIQGDFPRPRSLLEEGPADFRRLGADYSAILAKEELGTLLLFQGEYEPAETLFNECLTLTRQAGARGHVASLRSLELLSARKSSLGVAGCLTALARLALHRGDIEQAVAKHKEALRLRARFPQQVGIARSLEGLANVALAAGHFRRAARLFDAGEDPLNDWRDRSDRSSLPIMIGT